MTNHKFHILVLCTGNSARSILAEVLINELAAGRIVADSAGSKPVGAVNPGAIDVLARNGHATNGLQSKSWDFFTGDEAPDMDLVITVCDNAAGESCPLWPGSPVTVHWGIPDPASVADNQRAQAFDVAYASLRSRIEALIELPIEDFDPRMRREALMRIHDAMP